MPMLWDCLWIWFIKNLWDLGDFEMWSLSGVEMSFRLRSTTKSRHCNESGFDSAQPPITLSH
jgi:hypothetical protein